MGDMSREPSMEEILSSIRRVIARDESVRSGGAPLPSPLDHVAAELLAPIGEPETGSDDDQDDDVLELTQTSETETDDFDMARQPAATARGARQADTQVDAHSAPVSDELLSPVTAAVSRQSIDALAAALASGREAASAPASVTAGDVTLNALVEAALRPMLKQWLDANLPPLVERIVAAEIARITGGR